MASLTNKFLWSIDLFLLNCFRLFMAVKIKFIGIFGGFLEMYAWNNGRNSCILFNNVFWFFAGIVLRKLDIWLNFSNFFEYTAGLADNDVTVWMSSVDGFIEKRRFSIVSLISDVIE